MDAPSRSGATSYGVDYGCKITPRIVSETLRRRLGVTLSFCPERFGYNVLN